MLLLFLLSFHFICILYPFKHGWVSQNLGKTKNMIRSPMVLWFNKNIILLFKKSLNETFMLKLSRNGLILILLYSIFYTKVLLSCLEFEAYLWSVLKALHKTSLISRIRFNGYLVLIHTQGNNSKRELYYSQEKYMFKDSRLNLFPIDNLKLAWITIKRNDIDVGIKIQLA